MALVLSGASLAPLTADAEGTAADGKAQAAPAAPVTRIYAHPRVVTVYGRARFSYGADAPGLSFRCRLRGPGRENYRFRACPTDSPTSVGGRVTYSGLRASRGLYTFAVQAYVPATDSTPQVPGSYAESSFHIYSLYSPSHYSPRPGASFNRPLSRDQRKVNINKMIATINSMPGYRQGSNATCPWAPDLRPSSIRISLYSLTGGRFARALAAAHRRCVSVQILMNNHLDRTTDGAWRLLEDRLGTEVYGGGRARRSFAHRCSYGCRGSGVLHTKMYLFDSSAIVPRYNRINSTVVMGSSNMTFNATDIQYNDLYTVRGRPDLYRTYLRMFNLMKRDDGYSPHLVQATDGGYQTHLLAPGPRRSGPRDDHAALHPLHRRHRRHRHQRQDRRVHQHARLVQRPRDALRPPGPQDVQPGLHRPRALQLHELRGLQAAAQRHRCPDDRPPDAVLPQRDDRRTSTATSRTWPPPVTSAATPAPGWCGPARTTSPRPAPTSTRS